MMSAVTIPVEESVEAFQESLIERMARGRLPFPETLQYVTQIATSLRDLHRHGLIYGAVSSQLIVLGPAGAELRGSDGLKRLGCGALDVTAFGAVLEELAGSTAGPAEWIAELRSVAALCRQEAAEMQPVLMAIRLLGLRARQSAGMAPGPVLVRCTAPLPKVRRVKLVFHWKPLASLAAFALGK
jgi:hypothetical protein